MEWVEAMVATAAMISLELAMEAQVLVPPVEDGEARAKLVHPILVMAAMMCSPATTHSQ